MRDADPHSTGTSQGDSAHSQTPGDAVSPRQRLVRVVLAGLIILGYMVSRYFIYARFPLRQPWDWYRRDFTMTGPRVMFFLLALFLCMRCWTPDELGLHRRGLGPALVALAVFLLEQCLRPGPLGPLPHLAFLVWFSLVTIPVALFEEISFRGALLLSLMDWRGRRVAIWLSSLAFMVFHVQAQPLRFWPGIGLFGLVLAILRTKGVSILWLAAIHWLCDSLSFPGAQSKYEVLFAVMRLCLVALLAFACSRLRPVPAPSRSEPEGALAPDA
jgi:membrane protease YdiL (CAAX protease family)